MRSLFLSYRRGDSEGQARALHSELVKVIGKDSVFMDVDSIGLGRDFRHVLDKRLESCDLMLALIGPGWLDAKDAAGNRRLESATDLVRHEIAAALKRNIPVTPVLLQGAQMPSPTQLPDDIKDLAYRNGFELDHSTWESDVSELVKRLGLESESAGASSAGLPVSGSSRTRWVIAIVAVAAILGAVSFYQKPHDQSSGGEIGAARQQAAEPPSQPAAGSQPEQSGLGAIKIANLTRTVEVYEQSSSGEGSFAAGYAGTLSRTRTDLQVPAGTYKLKFANIFVEHVAVKRAGAREIATGTISVPNLTRTVEVYEQASSAEGSFAAGYAGNISASRTTLQVPPGTYKLKMANVFIQQVVVSPSEGSPILLGTISLPNLTRTAEVYEQSSSGAGSFAAGYAGTMSPGTRALQVPPGTYKLKLANLFVPVRVEPGKTVTVE